MIGNYSDLENKIEYMNNFLSRESGKRDKILEQIKDISADISTISKNVEVLEKVNILLQKTSEYAREQAKKQIEVIVSNCLQYIFDSNMEFIIEIEELYGKPNAEFYVITKEGKNIIKTKPELSRGGGVVDIISLALRISFLQVHKPLIQGPLILDEPAKHVSEDFIFNVADFLKRTSEMFDRQIIMVTHNNHLSSVSTNSYRVQLKGTESKVEKVTPN
ncbi:ATPase [Anaerosalibacter bizertensis]|uniref:ATPase n=1 Tax=Anaerosalibacter bizertensis TaxID=932217 RepID=A0A844FFX7_9FIRM|nr:ATPase [Anaerosalibacter bizertensis]MSS42943.1 ATPase [Anaerosalibacter bizertensis]